MNKLKIIPYILLIVGTFGLLAVELFNSSLSSMVRSLVLAFSAFNMLGLIILALSRKEKETL
jgi:diacylglycerol kinase